MGDTHKRLTGPDRLPPMIGMYFGGKRRLGPKYPTPEHREIVEPFAGGAGYSLCHWRHDVTLYEKSEHVCAVWDYLIGAEPSDILALPVVEPGERVSEMGLPFGAEYLIRGWLDTYTGGESARDERICWSLKSWPDVPVFHWGAKCRQRIADHVGYIKHWRCIRVDDYSEIPDREATWFIDPPYQGMGKRYQHGGKDIDFARLGEWCRSRSGQVMVCENAGADWLPFEPFSYQVGIGRTNGVLKRSREVVWMRGGLPTLW